MNIVKYSIENELGTFIRHKKKFPSLIDNYHFQCRLPTIIKENEFDLSNTNINKIFCAQWLDDTRVILGTKCNKLVVLDTNTHKSCLMNPLKSHVNSENIPQNCGIHSISVNPSRSLLATGSENVNDIAIYRLPNLEPVCVGWNAHKNWIFDTVWIDDTHVVSGAGDSKLALWTIDETLNGTTESSSSDDYCSNTTSSSINSSSYSVDFNSQDLAAVSNQSNNNEDGVSDESNNNNEEDECDAYQNLMLNKRRRIDIVGKFKVSNSYMYKKATKVITCKKGKRIRAMTFNSKKNEIAALAMNASFHTFNPDRFQQNFAKKLSIHKENVCLAINSDNSVYAIGSASHVQLLIADTAKSLLPPIFVKKDIGIRSVSFRSNILSIGTGNGTVLFYDLRALKFLSNEFDEKIKLQSKGGWVLRNENYYDYLSYANTIDRIHAIYSHCYDQSGTKLFTAGGPLTVGLHGHYASVWR